MRKVYISFSTDIIHSGHIEIINKAAQLGELTVGVLTDRIVATYKRFPLMDTKDRMTVVGNIKGVKHVVVQDSILGEEQLRSLKPDFVVHGDDWKSGVLQPIREATFLLVKEWGGEVVEFPYSNIQEHVQLEQHAREQLSIPDVRRGRLKKLLSMKPLITAMEAHSGLTGLIVENTKIPQEGKMCQFDAMWISSLCDSTSKGKPDIELVDMSSRLKTIDEIMEVTTKPIIFDGDTGGMIEHFTYLVQTLERIGVSAVVIEDKTGMKKNSLFGTEVKQTQDTIEHFSAKILAGKSVLKTRDMMIIARIESLILEQGMENALTRAHAFVEAGADGIMIHSRRKEPDEIFEFCECFRKENPNTPLVVVPSSFNSVYEDEFEKRGVNIVIYANQLTRSAVPAMQKTAESILINHRAKDVDATLMPIKDIIRLIPAE